MDKKIGLILILLVFTIFSSVQAFSIAFCDNGVLEAGEYCDFGGIYNLTNSTYCFNLNQCDLIAASFCFENPSYSDETRMIDSLNNLWIGGAWSNVSNLTGSSFVDKRLIEHYSMGIPGGFRYCEYRNCEQGYSPVDGECVENGCDIWNYRGYCSRMECEVMNDGNNNTYWIRGLYAFNGDVRLLDKFDERISKLGCEYFYHIDPNRSIASLLINPSRGKIIPGGSQEEFLNIHGLIKVIEQYEDILGSNSQGSSGEQVLTSLFFIGYYTWKPLDIFYGPLSHHFSQNLPRYRVSSILSREIPELDNINIGRIFDIPKNFIGLSSQYTDKYCSTGNGLDHCNLGLPYFPHETYMNYAGGAIVMNNPIGLQESLIKKVYLLNDGDYFSLTHLSQTYLAGWPSHRSSLSGLFSGNLNRGIDEILHLGQNSQNSLGNSLGIRAKSYFRKYPDNKLSDFLKLIRDEALANSPSVLPDDEFKEWCKLKNKKEGCLLR